MFLIRIVMRQMTVTIVMVPIVMAIVNTVRQVDMVVVIAQYFPHHHIYNTPAIPTHQHTYYKVTAMKRAAAPTKRVIPEMSSTREPHACCFLFARIDEVLLVKAIIPLLNQSDKFQLDVCCRAWHSILSKPEAWKCLDLSPAQHGRRTRAGYVTHQTDPLSNNLFFVQTSHFSLLHDCWYCPLL